MGIQLEGRILMSTREKVEEDFFAKRNNHKKRML